MLEIVGDLFDPPPEVHAICLTTNGQVKANRRAVMGRGVARQALDRWPNMPALLGRSILDHGHVVRVFAIVPRVPGGGTWAARVEDTTEIYVLGHRIITFPVKHTWRDKQAPLGLIERSARQLATLVAPGGVAGRIALPRPGCGNGRRDWAEVRPILAQHLDDRFVVIENNP